jgi:hypothetical protein
MSEFVITITPFVKRFNQSLESTSVNILGCLLR